LTFSANYVILKLMKEQKTRITETALEIQSLSMTIERAALSLHNAIKYIHTLSMSDFYNVNIKDLFKISLSDITNPNILANLGTPPKPIEGAHFVQLADLLFFAFAVRTPYLMRNRKDKRLKVTDRFILELYRACVVKGAADPDNIVQENIKTAIKLSKSNRAEPTFNGEWFRRWVYFRGEELAAITNRNIFLLGCMDALLPLYYAKLTDNFNLLLDKTPEM